MYIAKWSCWAVRSMLNIAKELGYIEEDTYKKLYNLSEEISRMLFGFIRTLEN